MQPNTKPHSGFSRRNLIGGAGTAGLVAASASLLCDPLRPDEPAELPAGTPTARKGYHLTDHIKRYYQTTLV